MRVLGFDPGYDRLGIAILEGSRSKQSIIFSECFKTNPNDSFEYRLSSVGKHAKTIIKKYSPNCVAIETLFFSNNQKTAMRVAETRGVLIFVATSTSIPVIQYSPQEIKVAVSGSGRGSKTDVSHMLHRLLPLPDKVMYDDEYDAIAVALTCIVSQ